MADEVNKRVANFAAKHKKYRQTHTNEIKSYKEQYYQKNKDEIKRYYQKTKMKLTATNGSIIKTTKMKSKERNNDIIKKTKMKLTATNGSIIKITKMKSKARNKDIIKKTKMSNSSIIKTTKMKSQEKKQRHYQEKKDEINSNKQQYYQDNKDEINCNKQKESKDCYAQNRAKEFDVKGNFTTTIIEIPCDTTEYEIAPSPETAVINWYMCTGTWRLQWLMDDIQDLMIESGKSDSQVVSDKQQANNLIKILDKRISKELITPEKRKNIADKFYRDR